MTSYDPILAHKETASCSAPTHGHCDHGVIYVGTDPTERYLAVRTPLERDIDALRAEVERLNVFVAEMQPELGKLKTEIERLRADLTRAQAERDHLQLALNGCARAVERRREEGDRLRGYLKYLIGKAQDADDIQWMDEIDALLAKQM